jgi:hypothetical protein
MESIEQRRDTREKVTRAIVKHQRAFLDKGPEHIEPLKMQQIADQVGVHVTTVSRAVDDKWVQTPRGIFPLKRFFGGGTQTASGEEVAWETIKQKLLEIIGNEDKANPLSDEELVEKLRRVRLPDRATVTKYRKMLHIPSSRQRRCGRGSLPANASAANDQVGVRLSAPSRPAYQVNYVGSVHAGRPKSASAAATPPSTPARKGSPHRARHRNLSTRHVSSSSACGPPGICTSIGAEAASAASSPASALQSPAAAS